MLPKNWRDMTPTQRRAWRIDKWRNPGVEWKSPEAEADYKARVDRLLAALELRIPDRVPVYLNTGLLPASLADITPYEGMRDPVRAGQAWVDFALEFEPDAFAGPHSYLPPAQMFEDLDYRLYSWPGHGVAKEAGFQYNEKEWMRPDEYDHLISDPTDYMLRTYLPRTVGAFAGFAKLPSAFDFIELPFVTGHMSAWSSTEMAAGLRRLAQAAEKAAVWTEAISSAADRVTALGFPSYASGVSKAPFDILGDSLRGIRGIILDMFRCPDKVLAACDRLVSVAVDWAVRRPDELATPIVCLPLHKGADGFMSDEQFQTFYWPTLRKVILGLIEEGIIPYMFAEGRYGSRLETIMDLPKGTTVWLFDQTDMTRAKATIGRVACIQGNMPLSMLHAGTPEEVAARTRELIDVAGVGGGYILDVGAVADQGRAENLRVMLETAKTYGVY
jgi:uroporphyrinogen-III decarboxylase